MTLKLGRKRGVSAFGSHFKLQDYLVDPLPIWNAADDFTGGRSAWGMGGNDTVGDCGPVADYHKAMADAQTAGEAVPPEPDDGTAVEQQIVAEYFAYDNGQDNGVDLGQWLSYRMTHELAGLPKIGGFAQVSDFGAEYQSAFHAFGGLYTGILVSSEMMAEFNEGQPWSSTATDWEGGHCVPHLFRNEEIGKCVTWGRLQEFTWQNWRVCREECYVIFDQEMLDSPGGIFHGVNVQQLATDIKTLGGTL